MSEYFPQKVSEYTKEQCQEYLAKYPNGLSAEAVRERLEFFEELEHPRTKSDRKPKSDSEDDALWNKIPKTILGLSEYQRIFPNGKHIRECNLLIKKLSRSQTTTKQTHSIDPEVVWGWICIIFGVIFIICVVVFAPKSFKALTLPCFLPIYYGVKQLEKN